MASEIAKVQTDDEEEEEDDRSATPTPPSPALRQEYKDAIKESLMVADYNLKSAFEENYDGLDLLSNKIEVYLLRMKSKRITEEIGERRDKSDWNLLENDVKLDDLREFEEIKTSLRENVQKILSKIEEIEVLHQTLVRDDESSDQNLRENSNSNSNSKEDLTIQAKETELTSIEINETSSHTEQIDNSNSSSNQEDETTVKLIVDPKTLVQTFMTDVSAFAKGSFDRLTSSQVQSHDDITQTDSSQLSLVQTSTQTQPSIVPDLTRRKAFEDLNQKLKDLDATDSLESFNVLMSRKFDKKSDLTSLSPDTRQKAETKIAKRLKRIQDDRLKQKYAGSVWFFRNKSDKLDKGDDLIWRSTTMRTESSLLGNHHHQRQQKKKKSTLKSSMSSSIGCEQPAKTIEKCQSLVVPIAQKICLKPSICQAKLKYYDLLDDLKVDDLRPFQSEYPRKDQVAMTTNNHNTSLLANILDSHDNIWKQLIVSPKLSKPKRSAVKVNNNAAVKSKNAKNLMKYLTEPQRRANTQQNVIVMPVQVYYDNFPTKDNSESSASIARQQDDIAVDCSASIARQQDAVDCSASIARQQDAVDCKELEKLVDLVMEESPGNNENKLKVEKRAFFKRPDRRKTLTDLVPGKSNATKEKSLKLDALKKCQVKGYNEDVNKTRQFFVTDLTRLHQGGDCGATDRTTTKHTHRPVKVELIKKPPLISPSSSTSLQPFLDSTNQMPIMKMSPRVVMTALVENKKLGGTVVLPSQQQMHRKRLMLEHLKSLKSRNDNIQKNIQKAIDVIETKMIDILSPVTDQGGSDKIKAFGAMEKEITYVLELMKRDVTDDVDKNLTAVTGVTGVPKKVDEFEAEKDEAPKCLKPVTNVDILPLGPPPARRSLGNARKQKKNVTIYTKNVETTKLTDMADSEKLLSEVDNVVKKIDDIYTKFYDSNVKENVKVDVYAKPRPIIKPGRHSFNDVMEFLDNIKNIVEDPPLVVEYKELIGVAMEFSICHCLGLAHYCEQVTYYEPDPDLITFDSNEDEQEEELPLVTTSDDCHGDSLAIVAVDDSDRVSDELSLVTSDDNQGDVMTVDYDDDDDVNGDAAVITMETLCGDHDNTLKTFYAIFFSTIFAALNLDFTS